MLGVIAKNIYDGSFKNLSFFNLNFLEIPKPYNKIKADYTKPTRHQTSPSVNQSFFHHQFWIASLNLSQIQNSLQTLQTATFPPLAITFKEITLGFIQFYITIDV